MFNKIINTPDIFLPAYGLPFAISPDGAKLRFLDEVVERAQVSDPELRKYIPALEELSRKYTLDKRTTELIYKIIKNYKYREPILLEGETATSKSSAVFFAAALLGLPVRRINFSKQTDLSELLGKYVPNSSAAEKEFWSIFHATDISGYQPETQKIIQKYRYETDGQIYLHALDNEDDLRRVAELEGIHLSNQPFVWQEGILPLAMRKGCLLLLDELNLMPPELLAALNPVLEENPSLLIPNILEIITKSQGLHHNFFVAATQNPTSYEGRQKLPSDLLRRFGFQLQVSLPTQQEINEMIVFFIYGTHPRFNISGDIYQAKPVQPFFPKLAQYQNINKLIGSLSRFHFEIQNLLSRKVLNQNRKQKITATRRDIFSFLAFLENYHGTDSSGQEFDFFTQPEFVLNKALDFYYTNHFIIDQNDFQKIIGLKKTIFGLDSNLNAGDVTIGQSGLRWFKPTIPLYPHTTDTSALRLSADEKFLYIHDQMLPRRPNLSAEDQKKVPTAAEISALCLDKSTVQYLVNLALAVNLRQPALIEGPTATAKTSGILYLAKQLNQPVIRFNLSGQSETAELIGKYVPADKELAAKYLEFFDHKSGYIFTEKSQALLNKAREDGRNLNLDEAMQIARNEGLNIQDAKWQWQKGPLILALEKGYWIILDELNQADTNILERLNSLLEENPTFLVSENGGADYSLENGRINPHFRIFATMNPAEYHGKKALSPAFLNRWTAYLQLAEPNAEELTQMLKFLIYGDQPQITLDGLTYNHSQEQSQYPKLAELLNVFQVNPQGIKCLFDQLVEFHTALARDLSADTRQRKLAQDNPELVLTRSNLKALLNRLEMGEQVIDQVTFASENILSSTQTRRQIILKALEEIYLDKFTAAEKEAVRSRLEVAGLTQESWAYNNILVRKPEDQALTGLLTKYQALNKHLNQTLSGIRTKDEASVALKNALEIVRDIENDASAYNVSQNFKVRQITEQLRQTAEAFTARRDQLVNNDAASKLAELQRFNADTLTTMTAAPVAFTLPELKALYANLTDGEIGLHVKRARNISGLSQVDLAAKIQLKTQEISGIERGLQRVSFEKLQEIAEACQVNFGNLITGNL